MTRVFLSIDAQRAYAPTIFKASRVTAFAARSRAGRVAVSAAVAVRVERKAAAAE